ncbi:MAG: TolC family protein [Pirellulaceae bacterium]
MCCLIVTTMLLMVLTGCSRKKYRLWADRDAANLISSRQTDFLWTLPDRRVEADPISRMADEYNPDCGPRPPDDPAAAQFQRRPFRFHNSKYWDKIAEAESIENFLWESYLPSNEDGVIELDRQGAVDMALLQSRDYQSAVESVYLSALSLSGNRFEFETQWFGNTTGGYSGSGRKASAFRFFSQDSALGFTRNLAAGGQLAASWVNAMVFNVRPTGEFTTSSTLLFSLTQPLLRGAFKHVRLESLTQAERNLLYDVRDFAQFRRTFYRDVTTAYLLLLAQKQSLINQRANLRSLELNLEEFEELYRGGSVSQIQVDQVFQDYQGGRIGLLGSEQRYANTLDAYKISLGLPPRVELEIDESLLKQFELSNPRFDELQFRIDELYYELMQFLPPATPPRELLNLSFAEYVQIQSELRELAPEIEEELVQWQDKIARLDGTLPREEQIDLDQQKILADQLVGVLDELRTSLQRSMNNVAQQQRDLDGMSDAEGWDFVTTLIGKTLRQQYSDLFIAQNQIRPFLIDALPFEIDEQSAIDMALGNRLDLMNQRAQTMDAFRAVEVAADALQSDLDFTVNASVGTDPTIQNPVRFDSSESSIDLALAFDGPLNRFNERNVYRAAQIFYQQARRTYMASEDRIVLEIRADLRRLRIARLNFQIARQSLLAAIRQVADTQFQLRTQTSADSSLTRDLLGALDGLLTAKNGLISSWIDYEVGRIQLFVDLELLYIDANGVWINETFNPGIDDPAADQLFPGTDPTGPADDSEQPRPNLDAPGDGTGEAAATGVQPRSRDARSPGDTGTGDATSAYYR